MGSNPASFVKICLNFHKMNRCHYLMEAVVILPLIPNTHCKNCRFKCEFIAIIVHLTFKESVNLTVTAKRQMYFVTFYIRLLFEASLRPGEAVSW